jgi:hypothetical protein
MPNIYRECKQCNCSFYITEKDQAFFNEKGLEFPKRCFTCRKKNKKSQEEAVHMQTWGTPNTDTDKE